MSRYCDIWHCIYDIRNSLDSRLLCNDYRIAFLSSLANNISLLRYFVALYPCRVRPHKRDMTLDVLEFGRPYADESTPREVASSLHSPWRIYSLPGANLLNRHDAPLFDARLRFRIGLFAVLSRCSSAPPLPIIGIVLVVKQYPLPSFVLPFLNVFEGALFKVWSFFAFLTILSIKLIIRIFNINYTFN